VSGKMIEGSIVDEKLIVVLVRRGGADDDDEEVSFALIERMKLYGCLLI
jgi:hypothetical protein